MNGTRRSKKSPSKDLKAFTITEMLIAVLLSAILLAMVVSLFSYFLQSVRAESKNMDRMEEIILLESILSEKARRCDSLSFDDDWLLFYDDDEIVSVAVFDDDMIITEQDKQYDTFRISHSSPSYSYISEKIRLISKVYFTAYIGNQSFPVTVIKEPEGEVMVNAQTTDYEN